MIIFARNNKSEPIVADSGQARGSHVSPGAHIQLGWPPVRYTTDYFVEFVMSGVPMARHVLIPQTMLTVGVLAVLLRLC